MLLELRIPLWSLDGRETQSKRLNFTSYARFRPSESDVQVSKSLMRSQWLQVTFDSNIQMIWTCDVLRSLHFVEILWRTFKFIDGTDCKAMFSLEWNSLWNQIWIRTRHGRIEKCVFHGTWAVKSVCIASVVQYLPGLPGDAFDWFKYVQTLYANQMLPVQ
jgi:hypothetical protein